MEDRTRNIHDVCFINLFSRADVSRTLAIHIRIKFYQFGISHRSWTVWSLLPITTLIFARRIKFGSPSPPPPPREISVPDHSRVCTVIFTKYCRKQVVSYTHTHTHTLAPLPVFSKRDRLSSGVDFGSSLIPDRRQVRPSSYRNDHPSLQLEPPLLDIVRESYRKRARSIAKRISRGKYYRSCKIHFRHTFDRP